MIDKNTYWDRLNELTDAIYEAEDEPSYCLEMDMSYLPELASLALTGNFDLCLDDYDDDKDCIDDMYFLARNGFYLPSDLKDKPFDEIKEYVLANEDKILELIMQVFEDYYDDYYSS